MEEVKTKESWNKKKIIFAVILLILLTVGGLILRIRILGQNSSQIAGSVKGVATESVTATDVKANIQEAVKEKIDGLKQQVFNLNVSDIASSSPQVQKILNDIKELQDYPVNQVKEICRKICGL
jgi:hypothetical protein